MDTNHKEDIALIVNGEFPRSREIINQIKSAKIIIAVDGATNTLIDAGITPTVSIGDFDSINLSYKDKVSNTVHVEDQNKTDLEKTLDWCIKNNYLSLSIFGISGKSEDHFLGNFFAINEYSDTINCTIYTDYSTITPSIGKTVFNSFRGETVSIISFESTNKVTSTNLQYVLDAYKLFPSARAIRNQSLGNNFTIESSEKLMVFQIKD
ncbi:thiamine diphosphokinase [Candidatus Marinimicrobia bacterium]|jgi:thiamine pyrophosphokinase|nr:thiamine diphosphokinase [Candidatus Neomarinimicrobiota bacterium]MBT4317107.1 thiamine diphosphokinase [Candidatus Neomarinimicrobiota bacterium]MBT4706710.1 thiamine diphosphokinase [Candidatus Neomarinimicrobiota bacterium]MDC0918117.1 thiamine diphosphokinase [Candidatus Neomarinimicrobiota bacterium]